MSIEEDNDGQFSNRSRSKKFDFDTIRPYSTGTTHKKGRFHAYKLSVDFENRLESHSTRNRMTGSVNDKLFMRDDEGNLSLKWLSESRKGSSREVSFHDDGSRTVKIRNQSFNKEYILAPDNKAFITHYSDQNYSNDVTFHDQDYPSMDNYTRVQRFGSKRKVSVSISGDYCEGYVQEKNKTYKFQAPRSSLRADENGGFQVDRKFAKMYKYGPTLDSRIGPSRTSSQLADMAMKAGFRRSELGSLSMNSERSSPSLPAYNKLFNASSKSVNSVNPAKVNEAAHSPALPTGQSFIQKVKYAPVDVTYVPNPSFKPPAETDQLRRPGPGFAEALKKRKGAPPQLSIPKDPSTNEKKTEVSPVRKPIHNFSRPLNGSPAPSSPVKQPNKPSISNEKQPDAVSSVKKSAMAVSPSSPIRPSNASPARQVSTDLPPSNEAHDKPKAKTLSFKTVEKPALESPQLTPLTLESGSSTPVAAAPKPSFKAGGMFAGALGKLEKARNAQKQMSDQERSPRESLIEKSPIREGR